MLKCLVVWNIIATFAIVIKKVTKPSELGGLFIVTFGLEVNGRQNSAVGNLESNMKTKERIESVIFAEFETLCGGVYATKQEFVNSQLNNAKSDLALLYAAKKKAADDYKDAENAYLLQTSVGETQTLVLLKAAATFAAEKEDKGFLLWLQGNGVLLSINEVVTDTPTRLLTWLNNTYESYVKGRREAIDKKKAAAEKKAQGIAAVEELKASGLSLEEIIAAFGK